MERALSSPTRALFLFALIALPILLIPRVALSSGPVILRPKLHEVHSGWLGFTYREADRPRVALVLSGGGARGIAQIGALKALERHDIPVDFISATSLGAVVGGLYAAGYTPAELESLAVSTNWDEILSLTEDTRRSDLFVEQKRESERTFFSLRFEGFEPVLPSAVSSGQRLTNFLSFLALQSVYHPDSTFDDLRIPFRAVSTDLISGKRVIMSDGSLAEALRASVTVPLLFTPVEKDSLRLVDGGLVSNIPVDLARDEGYDLVFVVNTTSGMRQEDELNAPWQTADQIMGIMMQASNKEELSLADGVVVPDLGRHLSSDFSNLDSLIIQGEKATENAIPRFLALYDSVRNDMERSDTSRFRAVRFERTGFWGDDSFWSNLWDRIQRSESMADVERSLSAIASVGTVGDVSAEVFPDEDPVRVLIRVKENPVVTGVRISGVTLFDQDRILAGTEELIGHPASAPRMIAVLERILRMYRNEGYSLARIESARLDSADGLFQIAVSEGTIRNISVEGAERTEDYVVLREFPLHEGDVFQIGKARRGLQDIAGTTLFEYVQLEVLYSSVTPDLVISLKERPSQLLSIGLRSDNERNLQGLLDIRDDNLGGTGSSLSLTVSGGSRNQEYALNYQAHRLFSSTLSLSMALFGRVWDSYLYGDAVVEEPDTWRREKIGEYSERRFGGFVNFGSQLERIGNAYVQYGLEDVKVRDKENAASLAEEYTLSRFRIGTVVDSKNSYPFPTAGVGMDFSFEFAFRGLGGDVNYNALRAMYESYFTWGGIHTLHPKLTVGFADKTMPFGEEFRLGGREMMFGTREDDRRGRQLILLNVEYRWRFPFRILFDTYFHVRYDLGTISEIPEQIKFSSFRHGVGAEISLDTPIGPGFVGVGKSFYFLKLPTTTPIQEGPVLFYFMIGYQL